MRYILLCLIILFISCGNEKELQLPQIDKADITELQDVSAAYLFYDETQPDSVLLNRKNLISTTNWLINVDKRLTLKQAIPHIKFLQDKKKSSSHKNEKAKNYFTCHDLNINNLGFLEFTDTEFRFINSREFEYHILFPPTKKEHKYNASFGALTTLAIMIKEDSNFYYENEIITLNQLENKLKSYLKEYNFIGYNLELLFSKNLTFQKYIELKAGLMSIKTERIHLDDKESIFN